MIFDSRPSIVGHRGFGSGQRGGYRENTVASCLAAVACGLSWVELDVYRTRDGELVVRHDPVAPSGEALAKCTAAELAIAGVASLADVLAALPADVAVDIDVKTIIDDAVDPPARRTHALVAEILHRQRGTRRFFVSSFDPSAVLYLADQRDFTGDVAVGLITGIDFPAQHAVPAAANLGLDAVCLHTGSLNLHRDQIGVSLPDPRANHPDRAPSRSRGPGVVAESGRGCPAGPGGRRRRVRE